KQNIHVFSCRFVLRSGIVCIVEERLGLGGMPDSLARPFIFLISCFDSNFHVVLHNISDLRTLARATLRILHLSADSRFAVVILQMYNLVLLFGFQRTVD
ncbi:hypothetical protein ACJX0J_041285, partial [Zea mays]